jgi:F-type H+-transporting ATPase subunit b
VLINWFTVLAQIVNFLILIYLLKRFLFTPILRAMAEREKKMANALNRAEEAERKAQEKLHQLEKEKCAFDEQRHKLMIEAQRQVAQWRDEALQNARNEVENFQRAWTDEMKRTRRAFLDRLKEQLLDQVIQVSKKVLKDLADQALNRQVLEIFFERVSADVEREVLDLSEGFVVVQSGIPFETQDQKQIEDRLSQFFPAGTEVRVETDPELGLGIQLLAGDLRTAWQLSDYLRDLESEMMEKLFNRLK